MVRAGAPMKVMKWSPDFYPSVESPVVPVWVGLPGLPLHFFDKSALYCIASVLGTPLKIDEPTAKMARPTVARVCIEVDVSKPRNHRIWLGDEKDGYWQDVVFENPPQYCDFCKMLGHENTTCHKKNPELLQKPKKVLGTGETSMEKNISSGLYVENFEKPKDVWKKREAEPGTIEPKHTEEWTMVGGKKKNKPRNEPSKESAEKVVAEGNMEKSYSSDIPVMTPAEGRELQTMKISQEMTGTFPKNPNLKVQRKRSSVAEVQLATVGDRVETFLEASLPTDGDKTSSLSLTRIGIQATDFSQTAIALTQFSEASKIQSKLKSITTSGVQSGPSKLHADSESKIRPSDEPLCVGERVGLKPSAAVLDTSGRTSVFSGIHSQPRDSFCSNDQDASKAKSGRQLAGEDLVLEACHQPKSDNTRMMLANEFEFLQDKIQPLDLENFKIQPLDNLLISDNAAANLVNNGGFDSISLEENAISSQPLVLQFQSQPSVPFCKEKSSGLLDVGFGNSVGPKIIHTSRLSVGPEVLLQPGSPTSSGPPLLEELIGTNSIVPINLNGELILDLPWKNFLHLKEPLFQFLQGRGILLKPPLKIAIINFLSDSDPNSLALNNNFFTWEMLSKIFFRHLRNLNIKSSRSFKCAIEQFFQCVVSIVRKNFGCVSFDTPILACPQIEPPPQGSPNSSIKSPPL